MPSKEYKTGSQGNDGPAMLSKDIEPLTAFPYSKQYIGPNYNGQRYDDYTGKEYLSNEMPSKSPRLTCIASVCAEEG